MAVFKTHVGVAVCCGIAATGAGLWAGLWPLASAPALVGLTSLGGIMPDIDSDNSHSVRVVFTLLAVLVACSALLLLAPRLSAGVVISTALALYIAIRDILSRVFKHLTRHRGIWHSLLAVVLVALLGAAASFHLFAQSAVQAWYQGAAISAGMLIHLLLDECCSIDFAGRRLRRSFGSALKLYNYRRPATAVLMLTSGAALYPWLPPLWALHEASRQLTLIWS